MSNVHIYAPPVVKVEVSAMKCPFCGCYANILVECWEWHDAQATCLMCGDAWSDGERMERPFCPGWRNARIEQAKMRREKYKAVGLLE